MQGKHYMTFVALVLPKIALSLGKEESLIKEIMEKRKVEEDGSTNMITEKKKEEEEVLVVKDSGDSEPQTQGNIKPPEEKEMEKEKHVDKDASRKKTAVPDSDEINSTVEIFQKGVEQIN